MEEQHIIIHHEHRHHRRQRVWPKLLLGLLGAYFVAHGSVLVGMVAILLVVAFLANR